MFFSREHFTNMASYIKQQTLRLRNTPYEREIIFNKDMSIFNNNYRTRCPTNFNAQQKFYWKSLDSKVS